MASSSTDVEGKRWIKRRRMCLSEKQRRINRRKQALRRKQIHEVTGVTSTSDSDESDYVSKCGKCSFHARCKVMYFQQIEPKEASNEVGNNEHETNSERSDTREREKSSSTAEDTEQNVYTTSSSENSVLENQDETKIERAGDQPETSRSSSSHLWNEQEARCNPEVTADSTGEDTDSRKFAGSMSPRGFQLHVQGKGDETTTYAADVPVQPLEEQEEEIVDLLQSDIEVC